MPNLICPDVTESTSPDRTYYGTGALETEVLRNASGSFSRFYYREDGTLRRVTHHDSLGRVHRRFGPAFVWYYGDGATPLREAYYIEGRYHRDGDPAVYWFNADGTVKRTEWYLNGEKVSAERGAHV